MSPELLARFPFLAVKTVLGFFVAVIAVAALSTFCTLRWTAAHPSVASVESHQWLHDQLHLTAEQHAALDPVEARYAERQHQDANRGLARAMGEGKAYSPAVSAPWEKSTNTWAESLAPIDGTEARAVDPGHSQDMTSLCRTSLVWPDVFFAGRRAFYHEAKLTAHHG